MNLLYLVSDFGDLLIMLSLPLLPSSFIGEGSAVFRGEESVGKKLTQFIQPFSFLVTFKKRIIVNQRSIFPFNVSVTKLIFLWNGEW